MKQVWVFNRTIQWHDEGLDGCLLSYSAGGDLMLTGASQVSSWHSDPTNVLTNAGDFTRFEKKATIRCRDCTVLPALQFHLGQHHRLEVTVAEASSDWQFCLSVKGRSGQPFASSGWRQGAGSFTVDIESELRKRGYGINFVELHFVIGTWSEDAHTPAFVKFRATLRARPALVACL